MIWSLSQLALAQTALHCLLVQEHVCWRSLTSSNGISIESPHRPIYICVFINIHVYIIHYIYIYTPRYAGCQYAWIAQLNKKTNFTSLGNPMIFRPKADQLHYIILKTMISNRFLCWQASRLAWNLTDNKLSIILSFKRCLLLQALNFACKLIE